MVDWEKKRWWLARLLLRGAGWLLSKSHPTTVYVQTSSHMGFRVRSPDDPQHDPVVLMVRKGGQYAAGSISTEDIHGILIQAAYLDYLGTRQITKRLGSEPNIGAKNLVNGDSLRGK